MPSPHHGPAPVLPPPPAPPSRAAAVTAAGCLAAAAVLTVLVAVAWQPLLGFDREVAGALHRSAVAKPGLARASRIMTDWFWDPWAFRLLIAAMAVWLWVRGERRLAVWVAVATVVGAAVSQGLKTLVGRERPQWPDPVDSAHYAAYPSGHALTAVLGCCLLLWVAVRRGARGAVLAWGAGLAVVSVLGVGFTRVYLGVHWASDVLAGWLLGALVAALTVLAYERMPVGRGRPRRR